MDFTLYKQFRQLTNWLLPPSCAGCQKTLHKGETDYCIDCESTLPYLESSCSHCGQPFSNTLVNYCGKCLSKPPAFDACFCPFEYAPPISDEICQLKYGEQPQIAQRLVRLFIEELKQYDIEMPDALIAVPMHASELRKRGFNQSTELAKHLSKELEIPLITGMLSKTRATPRQATQTLVQRKRNLRNSFKIEQPLNFKHLAIVDDVVTTGATAEEIAKTLKKNGVNYLQIWGIARTR